MKINKFWIPAFAGMTLLVILVSGFMANGCGDQVSTYFEVIDRTPTLEAVGVVYSEDMSLTFALQIYTPNFTLEDLFAAYGSGHTAGTPDLSQARMAWSNQDKTVTVSGIKGWSNLDESSGPRSVHIVSAPDKIIASTGDKMSEGKNLWKCSLSAVEGVASTYPIDGATNITASTYISATFTDAMDAQSISAETFTVSNGSGRITGAISYDATSRTAYFTPLTYLLSLTTYHVTVDADVKFTSGTPIGSDYTWSFTTKDDSPPLVSAVSPADGSTVAISSEITAVFNKVMDASTINSSSFKLYGSEVSGEVTYDANTRTVTFTPSQYLQSSHSYTATLFSTIADSVGNNLSADYTWTFSTEASNTVQVYRKDGSFDHDGFGIAASRAGDVNNDGFDDFIIGATNFGPELAHDGANKAFVYSGADGSLLYEVAGETSTDMFGLDVDGAGDVNNDGYDDFIVGAPSREVSGMVEAGKVYVYSGADGSLLCSKEGETAGDNFGFKVAGLGDINGDGHSDFVVTAPMYDSQRGKAYLYSGQDYSEISTGQGSNQGDVFGYAMDNAGDVDGDGVNDVIFGAPFYPSGNNDGQAFVVSGQTGALITQIDGPNGVKSNFGSAVAGLGDVNGDGRSDYAIGAMAADAMSYYGRVNVYSGTGALLYTLKGTYGYNLFGGSLSGKVDLNGDGLNDLIVGCADYTSMIFPTFYPNRAYAYAGIDGTLLWESQGSSWNDLYGWAVGGVGKIDDSGRDAFIVGAWLSDASGNPDAGSAFVYQLK